MAVREEEEEDGDCQNSFEVISLIIGKHPRGSHFPKYPQILNSMWTFWIQSTEQGIVRNSNIVSP